MSLNNKGKKKGPEPYSFGSLVKSECIFVYLLRRNAQAPKTMLIFFNLMLPKTCILKLIGGSTAPVPHHYVKSHTL